MLTRRRFLGAAAGLVAGALVPRRARALGDAEKFAVAQLELGPGSNPRPTALKRVLWEIDKRTSIDVRLEPVAVRLADAQMYKFPFLYLAGDRAFAAPSDADVTRLRRHLQAGGFLVVDSADERQGPGSFDASVRALAARLFSSEPLKPLDGEHVVYKSFYLLKGAPGRVVVAPGFEAVQHDGRAALVYCRNDLGGAWARDNLGRWEFDVAPGGEEQREMAFRVGVNLAMYATCLDYKSDQVHVPFILHRRQWRPE